MIKQLQEEVSDFENLVGNFEKSQPLADKMFSGGERMLRTLFEFYAMMSAFWICECAGGRAAILADDIDLGAAHHGGTRLPKHADVRKSAQDLSRAVASEDRLGVSAALEEMGVLALSSATERQFPRLESVAGCLTGRARTVLLIELVLFAVDVEEYERAERYALETRAFGPISRELYNLVMAEGLVALEAGRIEDAILCLARSIDACLTDVDALIECGLPGPNLRLVEKLLDHGEQAVVLEHLRQCENVWQSRKPHIENWISAIEAGGKSDFQTTRFLKALDRPAAKLDQQWMRVFSLDDRYPGPPKPLAEVLAEKEARMAKLKPLILAATKRRLDTSKS